jgi:hypothetical protein
MLSATRHPEPLNDLGDYGDRSRPILKCWFCEGDVEIYTHDLAYCRECKTEYYATRLPGNRWVIRTY